MPLQELQEKADKILKELDKTSELDLRETFSVLETLRDLNEGTVARADNCRVAMMVYEATCAEVESLEEQNLGADLAYVMGAICKNGFVEWDRDALPELHDILKRRFPIDHPVWSFIAIMNGEEDDGEERVSRVG